MIRMSTKIKNRKNKGFTLIELLVTITIFVILTGVVLFSQNSFDNSILIKNLAYDISLTIRQAQDYGVDVNESVKSQLAINPFAPYGVYFNLNSLIGSFKNYIFFTDTYPDPSGKIDNMYHWGYVSPCLSNDSECLQRFTISNGNSIKDICVGSDSLHCTSILNLYPSYPNLTILFKRPDPTAWIYAGANPSLSNPGTLYNYADIQVSSPNNKTRDIIVTSVGQIYVQ